MDKFALNVAAIGDEGAVTSQSTYTEPASRKLLLVPR